MAPSNPQYQILPRTSSDLEPFPEAEEEFKDKPLRRRHPSLFATCLRLPRRICRLCLKPIYLIPFLFCLFLWQTFFNQSYTSPSPFQIPENERVYIAANIIDGDLITGAWGRSLLQLVDLIGKDRVFVSIYGGPTQALEQLGGMLECEHELVSEAEDPLDMGKLPRTTLPTGETRVKRIAFLAEVRNKALEPLQRGSHGKFDKVLFINDVFFDAVDATRLLWGTNVEEGTGKATYKAACGADFVGWWKMYDTFATRDAEGYSIGVPIFPWFANEGDAATRNDVLAGKDAVRVKSCWGGITAFDARYLQPQKALSRQRETPDLPLTFRSEPEPFWDSSECCLIHADIMALPSFPTSPAIWDDPDSYDKGIYMNPNVRVSYDAKTQSRLHFARRVERLFAWPQAILNVLAHMPVFNARRLEVEGQIISDRLWVSNPSTSPSPSRIAVKGKRATIKADMKMDKAYWHAKGHYVDANRTATRGAYCGVRQLLVVKEGPLKEGEGNWDNLMYEVPPLGL
jgi:hypothetical protein